MITTRTLTMATLILLSINPVSAELLKTGPSVFDYNYVDAAYIDDGDADGPGLRFSADIRENYALTFGYSRLSAGGFDADTLSGDLIYHIEATKFPQKADWVFNLGILLIDVDGNDEAGLNAGAGIRYAVNDPLEVNGSINLTTAFDADLALNLRALYELSAGFTAFIETDIGNGSALAIGARFYWR